MKNSFCVIFDMDGVLVNSNPVHKESLQIFFREHNHSFTEEYLRERIYGRTNQEWIAEVFGDIPPEEIERLAAAKEKLFREMFDPGQAVIPGLFDFLEQLDRRGISLVVATSAPRENADYILSELAIEDYFDTVLDSSHVKKGKPDPEVYLKAAGAAGYPPERCIVIEDSLAGVISGLKAGARVVGITSTHTHEELKDCDLTVDDFTKLTPRMLESLIDNPRSGTS
jgi:beta-phosphoglucomutase